MRLNLDLVSEQLFRKQRKIASDYGIEHPDSAPGAFARQVITVLNQPPAPNPLQQEMDDRALFRAAVLAIWSSSTMWSSVVKRQDTVSKMLHQYDPIATVATNVSKVDLAKNLGSQYANDQANAMLRWATMLCETPNYYARVIRPVAEQLQQLAGAGNISDQELMLCLAVFFADGPPKRWQGYGHLPAFTRAAQLKLPGMGFAITCEFLRNLGWSGFKPDVHITRLFRHWTDTLQLPLDNYRQRAEELVGLVGRRTAHMVDSVQLGLAGIDLTPDGVDPSAAYNLVWLLGAYVEKKGHESDERYVE
jgi:hypothetical protein